MGPVENMSIPKTTAQWTVKPRNGLDGLQLEHNAPIPELGETACLVEIAAVSLNYRDVAIPTGKYPMKFKDHLVLTSDGAGIIVATGSKVKLHQVGNRVCTLFNQGHQSGFLTRAIIGDTLGSAVDGPLRKYAIYEETGLVPAPNTLSLREAATLPCAAVTAWNALTGISDRAVKAGDYILVQGTGGVSLFAAQFALAVGATIIATTSSDEKAQILKSRFGIQYVLNYRTDPRWGETAKGLTPNGEGVHHVIEVGGETTMAQSLKAIRPEGVISIIGFLGGSGGQKATYGDALQSACVVRGVKTGSKEQFVRMNEFIDEHGIKPVIDEKVFRFKEARDAFQYLLDGKHFGKVVIDVGGKE